MHWMCNKTAILFCQRVKTQKKPVLAPFHPMYLLTKEGLSMANTAGTTAKSLFKKIEMNGDEYPVESRGSLSEMASEHKTSITLAAASGPAAQKNLKETVVHGMHASQAGKKGGLFASSDQGDRHADWRSLATAMG